MPNSISPAQRRAELILIVITLLWGSSFSLVKTALQDSSTLLFLLLRFSAGALILGAFWNKQLNLRGFFDKDSLRGGFFAGLCLAAGYLFQTAGLRLTSPSKCAFLTASSVALVPLLSSFVYKNVPPVSELLGVALAFAGMAALSWPRGGLALNSGDLLTVVGAIAYSGQILIVGKYSPITGHAPFTVVQLSTVAALMALSVPWAEAMVFRPSPRLWFALGMTAVVCTAISFAVQAWAQQHTTPTRTGLIFALEPLSACLIAYAAFGETLEGLAIVGAGLILAGVVVVEMKPLRASAHPNL